MATLIQSKQIEGIVTASVVDGDFSISGSLLVSGSGIFTNDISASGVITATFFEGDGSRLRGVVAESAGINILSGSIDEVASQIELSGSGISLVVSNNTASITVDGTDISHLNQFTESYFTDSQSFDTRIEDLEILIGGGGDSSITERIIALESFSSSLDNTFATDIEVAAVSASISASQTFISESIATSLSALSQSSGFINYVTNSLEQLTGIEVADFDNNTAVTFTNGVLKFIFGTPAVPTSIVASLSGFLTDRFNNVEDNYTVNGTWNNQGYTLISASLYEGSTLLTQIGSGTSLSFNTTTSGSHTYRLEYTASSPLDGTLFTTSTTTSGVVSKTNPASPTLSVTSAVQLGSTSNQIEQGATGSLTFTSSSANPSNTWNLVSVTTNLQSPYIITGSATGSTTINITATANYESPIGTNTPDLTTTTNTTSTFTKIRSLRHGASEVSTFTSVELENIGSWDTTIGGSIGRVLKGTTNPSGQAVTITWSGDKFHYIVYDSSRANLSNITTSGFGVLGQFSVTTIGQYKVYKTNTLQAGGIGSSITYLLT